jgi:hypothetical protein
MRVKWVPDGDGTPKAVPVEIDPDVAYEELRDRQAEEERNFSEQLREDKAADKAEAEFHSRLRAEIKEFGENQFDESDLP